MAKRSFSVATWTPTAVGDAANFTASGYQALQGGGASSFMNVLEIFMGGQAGASSPTFMTLARDSTVGASTTALTTGQKDAALSPFTAALSAAPVAFVAASTEPQRSSTLGLLNLSFNAFGGIVRWVAAPGEEIGMYGASASLGEVSLSAYTGGTPGLMGSHIIYEPF